MSQVRHRRSSVVAVAAMIAAFGLSCGRSEPLVKLEPYESAEVVARAYNFQVYPGSKFDQEQTETFRSAHFVMDPDSEKAPPMAIYVTDDSLEDVATYYVEKYGYPAISETGEQGETGQPPPAFYTSGDLASGVEAIGGILEELGRDVDLSNVGGAFRGAHISQVANLPRVTIQRPYVDFQTGQVVDRTMILMVKE